MVFRLRQIVLSACFTNRATHICRRLVLGLALLAWTSGAWAAGTWYLSPGGSDSSGDGSRERPWKTITYAAYRVPDDGSTIVLLDGLYEQSQSVGRQFRRPCVIRAENPYRARLRSPASRNRLLACYGAANVTFRGLEMFGSGATQGEYLVHVGTAKTHHVLFEDCLIHDCYNNDLVKVNDYVHHITFRGCVFFNQTDHGGDQHLDINTVTDIAIEDSILFNDYAGSGRRSANRSQGFVVVKNSGSTPNVTRRIALRRNIFLGWDGAPDQAFVLLGEDGKPFFEAQAVVIENNLFIHNSPVRSWGTLLYKGGLKDITFRANTVVGRPVVKWSGAYAVVCVRIEQNPPMGDLSFANNIWCDPAGGMPRFTISDAKVFAPDSKQVILNNIYWNGGKQVPTEARDTLVPDRDPRKHLVDPRLGELAEKAPLPGWDGVKGQFRSGQKTIRGEFERLVRRYAVPAEGSPALGAADCASMPPDDILGNPRGNRPDIGCFQKRAAEGTSAQAAVRFDVGPPDDRLFFGAFQGFGVEWDPFYWNENNRRRGTDEAGWKLITERLKTLRVPIVRMMFQLAWCQRDPDLKQWDWDSPQVKSAFRYLDFCQANDIHVVLTDWGWSVGSGRGRLYEKPDDPRFAAGIAAYLRELIVRRGYTCIKYLVVGNEPDNELAHWHSHAAYVAMYRNVDAALRREMLRDRVKLTGPDMAGQWDFMRKSIDAMKDVLDAYDFHRYASWEETANRGLPGTWESLWSHLDLWRGEVLRRDPAGARKPLLVTEMGSAGGSTDEQPKIDTFDYGLHMADYGTTLLGARIQAGIAWTAHDIYYFDGNQFMRWGMWRYGDRQWGLRPWSQAYGLLIRHAPRGSTRAPVDGTPPKAPSLSPCRCAALLRPGGGWNVFLVNRADHDLAAEIVLPEAPKADLALYRFDQKSLEQNPDRIDLPPVGGLSSARRLRVPLPPSSFTVLVEK